MTGPGCPGPLLCRRLPVLAPRKQRFGVEGSTGALKLMLPEISHSGAGELAQHLGAPVLAQDPGLFPSTYMAPHSHP